MAGGDTVHHDGEGMMAGAASFMVAGKSRSWSHDGNGQKANMRSEAGPG